MLMIAAAGTAALGAVVPAAGKGPAGAACPQADAAPTASSGAEVAGAVLCVLNAERAARHLRPLRADPDLRQAAQDFTVSLRPGRALRHRGPDGSTPQRRIADAGYAGGDPAAAEIGEVLGRSSGSSATPIARVRAWIGDGGTRPLLLSRRFRDVGVGVSTSDATTTFVVDLGLLRSRASGH
jgi:uncharacterized protein YkwD